MHNNYSLPLNKWGNEAFSTFLFAYNQIKVQKHAKSDSSENEVLNNNEWRERANKNKWEAERKGHTQSLTHTNTVRQLNA